MKIECIFIITHYKEYLNNRLIIFLNNLIKVQNLNIPIFLFINNNSNLHFDNKNFLLGIKHIQELFNQININIVFYDNSLNINEIFFQKIFNFQLENYKTILLLETDTIFSIDFIDKLNNDLKDYNNIWLYGSFYYGKDTWFPLFPNSSLQVRFHINGVAVYNRTQEFVNFINNLDCLNKMDIHYDMIIFNKLFFNNLLLSKCIDSKYILNISSNFDIDFENYKYYKENTCLLHTKNSNLLKNLL